MISNRFYVSCDCTKEYTNYKKWRDQIMKCGKLTAKLRDAVPVRFYENGKEIKRYKNIEIPDTIKELEFQNFKFDVPESGAITFKIFFAPGTLPETWPEARLRKTRAKIDEPIAPDAPRKS